jgi:hypothetical protein
VTFAGVLRKVSLEGEGYDTLNGCLGEGNLPSCLRASIHYRNVAEGFGRELERQRHDKISEIRASLI